VAVVDRRLRRRERDDRARVRVATARADRSAAVRERGLDIRAGVVDADLRLPADLGRWIPRRSRDDSTGVATVARRERRGMDGDLFDERGMDDAGPEREVKEIGDAYVVDVVADGRGRSAADV